MVNPCKSQNLPKGLSNPFPSGGGRPGWGDMGLNLVLKVFIPLPLIPSLQGRGDTLEGSNYTFSEKLSSLEGG